MQYSSHKSHLLFKINLVKIKKFSSLITFQVLNTHMVSGYHTVVGDTVGEYFHPARKF